MLVNNVGTTFENKFKQHTPEEIEMMIGLNVYPITFLSYSMIPKMVQRYESTGRKSLIINLSSFAAKVHMPKWAIYGATKIYDDYLSRGLRYEYRDSIDICSFTPNAVDTNLVSTVGWRRRNALPQI